MEHLHQIGDLVQKAVERSMQVDVPTLEYMSFIPQAQRSNMLLMTSHQPKKENMSTVFMGTIRRNYTEEMWAEDVKLWMRHYGNQLYSLIPILPNNEVPDAINSRDAIAKVENELQNIRQLPVGEKLRIILLGTGHSGFVYDAITYLLREWSEPNGMPRKGKYIQFVTSGDTKDRDMSNFCQWLCISGVCENIEFYNTMQYHPFGYCRAEYKQ